jgi:hypothetical protein
MIPLTAVWVAAYHWVTAQETLSVSWDQLCITLDLTFGSLRSTPRSVWGYARHTFVRREHAHMREGPRTVRGMLLSNGLGWCSDNTSLVFRSQIPGAGSVPAADVPDSTWFGFGSG